MRWVSVLRAATRQRSKHHANTKDDSFHTIIRLFHSGCKSNAIAPNNKSFLFHKFCKTYYYANSSMKYF